MDISVYAKLYDTTGSGVGDTLVLNNTPNFSYEGTLITDYGNKNNGNNGYNHPSWYDPEGYSHTYIQKIDILNEICPLSCYAWFYGVEVQNWNPNNLNTAFVQNMNRMFDYCYSLESLDLSSFDTSSVVDMTSMFAGCENLLYLNINSFYTPNVTNMQGMFSGCSYLEELRLYGFDTRNVINMRGMFSYCNSLKTIYVPDRFKTVQVEVSDDMFYCCDSIVGGNGTTYNSSYIDKTYARIDTSENPRIFYRENKLRKE